MARTKHPVEAVQRVLDAAHSGADWAAVATHNGVNKLTSSSGFRYRKLTEEHVKLLTDSLADNCNLTLKEMAGLVDDKFHVLISQETVRRALDGVCFTLKKTHRDNDYRNSPANKEKRRQYVMDLYSYLGLGKKVYYMDETNVNLWCARAFGWSKAGDRAVENNTAGKGKNIHVIACIPEDGLEYSKSRFGLFNAIECNEFIKRMLRHIARSQSLSEVVLVVDNAPCHTDVDTVFQDSEFAAASVLKLGSYSPMLNPIENVFSTYKSFLARNRKAIKQVPAGLTIAEHRSQYLLLAAGIILPEVVTEQLCRSCSRHTAPFHAMALDRADTVPEIGIGSPIKFEF